jgi:DNA-binding transcriptional MerR regulator
MTLPDLDALRITYRQLDHWTRRGYLHPTRDSPRNNRHWPPNELAVAERMGRAVRAGLTPYAAHKAARGTTDLGHGVTVTITTPGTEKP